MAYSAAGDVRKALVPSSDGLQPDPPIFNAADMSDSELENAIAEADSTIDGYIAGRYVVPVAVIGLNSDEDGDLGAVPHPIDFWSRTLAAYYATLTFRGSQDFADTDPIVRRYKDVMLQLQNVSSGKMSLNLPASGSTAAEVGAGAAYNPYIGDLWTPDDFGLTDEFGAPFPDFDPRWLW